jgi:hypothetical protein
LEDLEEHGLIEEDLEVIGAIRKYIGRRGAPIQFFRSKSREYNGLS